MPGDDYLETWDHLPAEDDDECDHVNVVLVLWDYKDLTATFLCKDCDHVGWAVADEVWIPSEDIEEDKQEEEYIDMMEQGDK